MFEERLFYAPSKVVVLKHIVTIEELGIDEEYEEILEDVREMAGRKLGPRQEDHHQVPPLKGTHA